MRVEGVAVTLGIGAAASRPDAEEELDATLQRADVTLYQVKRAGGNWGSGACGREPPLGYRLDSTPCAVGPVSAPPAPLLRQRSGNRYHR
jgi:GGDEF domain-containing protein